MSRNGRKQSGGKNQTKRRGESMMRWNDERGQAGLMTVVLLVPLVAVLLFGIGLATLAAAQVSSQRAADAAALAGCLDLPNASAAQADAVRYGASSGGLNASTPTAGNLESGNGGQTVIATVVSSGATSSAGATLRNDQIRVTVQRTQPIFGETRWGFGARAITARAACQRAEGGLADIVVLDPSNAGSMQNQGQFTLNLGTSGSTGAGGIVVNSSSATGLFVDGGSSLTADYIDVGNASGAYHTCGNSCSVSPSPASGTLTDPFASVPEPSVPGVPSPLPPGCTSNASNPSSCAVQGGTTIYPGVYYGGLKLGTGSTGNCNAGTPGTVTLRPGTYYLAGGNNQGGLTVCNGTTVQCLSYSANSCPSANGVMFFNGCIGSCPQTNKNNCGALSIQNSASLLLIPIQSGTYEHLMFFQSRGCTQNAAIQAGIQIGLNPTNASPPQQCGGGSLQCGAFYIPACPGGSLNSSLCSPTGTSVSVSIGAGAGGQVAGNCANGSGQALSGINDCINVAFIADTLTLTGQLQFNNPFIPSGAVNHGDIALSQ
jgi:Flp pilus assembly protein TadG